MWTRRETLQALCLGIWGVAMPTPDGTILPETFGPDQISVFGLGSAIKAVSSEDGISSADLTTAETTMASSTFNAPDWATAVQVTAVGVFQFKNTSTSDRRYGYDIGVISTGVPITDFEPGVVSFESDSTGAVDLPTGSYINSFSLGNATSITSYLRVNPIGPSSSTNFSGKMRTSVLWIKAT